MKKLITVLAVLGMVFALAPAAQADFPEGPYRIAFVTTATASGSTDIASLNAWVTTQAQATGAVDDGGALGTTWNVIGATSAATDVRANTDTEATDPDTPVYLVDGTLFAANLADFWSGDVAEVDNGGDQQDTLYITEMGIANTGASYIHTGLDSSYAAMAGFELDSGGEIAHGGTNNGYTPFFGNGETWGEPFGGTSLFAISGVIGGDPPAPTGTLILLK